MIKLYRQNNGFKGGVFCGAYLALAFALKLIVGQFRRQRKGGFALLFVVVKYGYKKRPYFLGRAVCVLVVSHPYVTKT